MFAAIRRAIEPLCLSATGQETETCNNSLGRRRYKKRTPSSLMRLGFLSCASTWASGLGGRGVSGDGGAAPPGLLSRK
jgi:hypothetical protein